MMDREVIKKVILEQNTIKKDKLIERTLFKNIKQQEKTPFIIIISGIRRCGKSTLLSELKTNDAYYVNFDDERFFDFAINDFQTLYELLIELFGKKEIFLFDEIQNIHGWERFVRRLHDYKLKVYVTGSNALMLSRELGTHLTGRNLSFALYPFSFAEFLKFKQQQIQNKLDMLTTDSIANLKRLFNEYCEKGGFPEFLLTQKEDYLKSIYENILYRDIIARYKLKEEKPLKEIIYYIAGNIGKEVSFNKLRELTQLTSATTIREYFEYFENSYLAFLISRYDPSLRKQIYYNKKVYLIDSALAKIIGFRIGEDKGRILENIVFLQLKRMNKEVYFHKQQNECDFLIRKGISIIQAIQVVAVLDQNTKNREIDGLIESMKMYKLNEGLILTEDQKEVIKIKNKTIIVKPIWQWLLETEES